MYTKQQSFLHHSPYHPCFRVFANALLCQTHVNRVENFTTVYEA